MRDVTDRSHPQGLWPTRRYWAGVLVALPALVTVAAYALTLTPSRVPEAVVAALGLLALAAAIALLLRDRHVRTMTRGQKLTWTVIGLVLALAVLFVVLGVLLAVWWAVADPDRDFFGP